MKMKKVIGITGGIASGKTNIAGLLRKKGYRVIDSDQISRKLSQVGGTLYDRMVAHFGKTYLNEDGTLNRAKLGAYIFQHEDAKKELDEISHPLIVEEIKVQLENSSETLIFVDIPLLYEAGLEYLCDEVICCYTTYPIQLKRLMKRDGIDEAYAALKISAQMSLEEKKKKATYVIDTSGEFRQTEEHLNQIMTKIKGENYGNY